MLKKKKKLLSGWWHLGGKPGSTLGGKSGCCRRLSKGARGSRRSNSPRGLLPPQPRPRAAVTRCRHGRDVLPFPPEGCPGGQGLAFFSVRFMSIPTNQTLLFELETFQRPGPQGQVTRPLVVRKARRPVPGGDRTKGPAA